MSTHESNPHYLVIIIYFHYKSIVVAFNIKYNSIVHQETCWRIFSFAFPSVKFYAHCVHLSHTMTCEMLHAARFLKITRTFSESAFDQGGDIYSGMNFY